jgi:hypothetical protein
LPDDTFYDNIHPYLKAWLYESWILQLQEEAEREQQLAIFLGSFSNPEAAQKMHKDQNPDYQSTPDQAEKTSEWVREQILLEDGFKQRTKKPKSRIVNG